HVHRHPQLHVMSTRTFIRVTRALVAAAVLGGVLVGIASGAQGGRAAAVGVAQSLAVSVPPDPVALHPGGSANVLVRFVNPGGHQVVATIAQRRIALGDAGLVSMGAQPDPRWDSMTYPHGRIVIPAGGYRNVPLTIRVPNGLAPNLY